ncbi:RNA polymerase sigma factor [Solirubrobacter deserti]|uniref:RNA polymerase sigma factor n=1 Tax=Solirubrobacter deserti TaxID=2282478 RepID=A0ABT4RHQ9_9ACTN|nr:RNA polymerase sigma factor [Solirubrobacter deserti]MDA0138090.1 RNA polymerase sigma factor [Solirubrobacter deserti]
MRAREDPREFAAFYAAYSERVLSYLVRRVLDPDTAFDLLSETFAKALERQDQFRGHNAEQEQGWLFAIARSELSHFWRSGKVERAAVERLAITVPALSSTEFERIESLAGLSALDLPLSRAFAALPSDQRQAIELRVLDDQSYLEMAETLGVSEPTARARVSRGLRALARAVGEAALVKDAA